MLTLLQLGAAKHVGSTVGDTMQVVQQATDAGRIFAWGIAVGVVIALAITVYTIAKKN